MFDVTLSMLWILILICIKTECRAFQFYVNEHTKVFENDSIRSTVDRDPKNIYRSAIFGHIFLTLLLPFK